jgi:hypothetical protein
MTRFPTYPKDILDRADALLSEKYPDGIVDPRFVEIACEAMMRDRADGFSLVEVVAIIDYMAERSGLFSGIGPKEVAELIAEVTPQRDVTDLRGRIEAIAKAIRGTK